MREYLEKHYSPENVQNRDDTVKLAIKALLEVVQSGSKSMELAIMQRGKQLEVYTLYVIYICNYLHRNLCGHSMCMCMKTKTYRMWLLGLAI